MAPVVGCVRRTKRSVKILVFFSCVGGTAVVAPMLVVVVVMGRRWEANTTAGAASLLRRRRKAAAEAEGQEVENGVEAAETADDSKYGRKKDVVVFLPHMRACTRRW